MRVLTMLLLTPFLLVTTARAQRIVGCAERTELATRAAARALEITAELREKVRAEITVGSTASLRTAERTLACMVRKFPTLTISCRSMGVAGITLPVVGRTLYINPGSILNRWAVEETNYAGAVIIHEASHKCGTTDAAYFRGEETPHWVGPIGWARIADTYEYWVKHGFCVPGRSC